MAETKPKIIEEAVDAAMEAFFPYGGMVNDLIVPWMELERDDMLGALEAAYPHLRRQIIEDLIEAANDGGIEADISWYQPDDTVKCQYLTDWLRSKKDGA